MSHVVGDVEDPESEDEDEDGAWTDDAAIAEEPAEVGGVANEKHGQDDGSRAGDDERTAATETTPTAIAHEADERLNEEAGERTAEPYDASPSVRDSELLNVRRQKRKLKRPAELNTARHR